MSRTRPATAHPRAGSRSLALAVSLVTASCGVADAGPPRQATAPHPFAGPSTASDSRAIAGRIEERLVAGSYVYLAVRDRDGELRWAVVMGAAPPLGADVALISTVRRTDFHSPRLRRDFAELHFATVR
jgi:hypothetical protein